MPRRQPPVVDLVPPCQSARTIENRDSIGSAAFLVVNLVVAAARRAAERRCRRGERRDIVRTSTSIAVREPSVGVAVGVTPHFAHARDEGITTHLGVSELIGRLGVTSHKVGRCGCGGDARARLSGTGGDRSARLDH
jgi:hypothetical protein